MQTSMQQRYPNAYQVLSACSMLQADLYLYLDEEEEIIGCNDALLQVTGFSSFEALQSHKASLPQLFLPQPHQNLPEIGAWRQRVAEGPLSVHIKDAHGAIRLYRVHIKSLDLDAMPLYVMVLDETTQLEKARQARAHYDGLTQKLMSSISRQFRTPLNSIVGFAGLLEQTEIDASQREYAVHIRDAAETITATVDNLVDLMAVEQEDVAASESFFDAMALLEPITSRYGELAQAKGVALLVMFDPMLPQQLMGDAQKLVRIMRNLIDNAIKFTDAGGQVFVEITCKKLNDERALVEYAVSDTGKGIKEESIATILQPFTTAESEEEQGLKGLGIGLNLSHKLLAAMHAKLRVASKVGRGSRFSFDMTHRVAGGARYALPSGLQAAVLVKQREMGVQRQLLLHYLERFGVEAQVVEELDDTLLKAVNILFVLNENIKREKIDLIKGRYRQLLLTAVITPEREERLKGAPLGADYELVLPLTPDKLYTALSMEPKAPLEPRTEEDEPAVASEQATILIAEDNPINQKLLSTLLKKYHYNIVIANNGREAVNAYLHDPYDLVLMDIDMPVMDGVTATRLIHEIDETENRGHTPVIALTAQALPGDKERLLSEGLDAHMPKPIDRVLLLRLIKEFLISK